jgi:hypothetical protein
MIISVSPSQFRSFLAVAFVFEPTSKTQGSRQAATEVLLVFLRVFVVRAAKQIPLGHKDTKKHQESLNRCLRAPPSSVLAINGEAEIVVQTPLLIKGY